MPADFESGFFVREPAWHGMGQVIDDYPTDWEEARKLAGLEWEPMLEPVYAKLPNLPGIPEEPHFQKYEEIQDFRRVYRSDNFKTLSIMRDSYTLISHKEMGEIVDMVLDQPNIKYEAGGSLSEGKQVWLLVRLDEPVMLPGDFSLTYPYVAILNRHDGGSACKLVQTNVRVVCANTFAASEAEAERDKTVYSFRHSKGWKDRLEEVRAGLSGARVAHQQYCDYMTELLGVKVTKKHIERFLAEFIPMPPEGVISDRVAKNVEEARAAVLGCLYSKTTEPIADTAYGLVQASGEYLDHLRGYRNKDSYLGRTLLRSEPLKAKAVKLVKEIVYP